MERKTFIDNDGFYIDGINGKAIDRLAAYEDTGLEPEEIEKASKVIVSAFNLAANSGTDMLIGRLKEIIRAEAEGRLLVLPCKVGDTVWFNTYKNNATECVGIQPHEVKRVDVYFLTDGAEIPQWEFDKTVFLTREEAEATLRQEAE